MGIFTKNLYELLQEETEQFLSHDGMRLHMHCWKPSDVPASRVVLIVHGLGGHGAYYASSLAPYLVPLGAMVYAPDLRGHGRSDGVRGDIESFGELEGDVAAAASWVRNRHPNLPFYLLGESMGTPLAILHAANSKPELKPDYLILAACVVAPTITPRIDEILRTAFYLATNRRKPALPITGREEQGIRDLEFIKVLKADVLFNKHVSVRFLLNMTKAMNRAAQSHHLLSMPTIILQGGKDITVRHRPTRAFFHRIAATDKEMHVFPEAFHAILNDPDAPEVRKRIINWIDRKESGNYQTNGMFTNHFQPFA
ncbi:MAG: alpha/beta fold hydrolase [Chloroflexi bacterium]|uniref:Alpha/beta fold hydrolase n=1 Tax=Candidatus Chlorohelix allophototropha TaxID=3003348 RepID=A0A8T7M0C7_9CHLR|nr:alpha/beta fold hydrolase [Chloroflexota bacterium]WJW66674.1 lysophospholipase [Chloroflexota bacterium L227-S17]